MKKIIILAGMLAAFSTVNAKDMSIMAQQAQTKQTQAAQKTKIDPSALPDAVKKTLAGDTYKDWKITSAWSVKETQAYYVIELQKDGKTNTLKIDANGKLV